MIRTRESSIFESAFFILRGASSSPRVSGEMITEANKIIEECNILRKKTKELGIRHILAALGIGFALGAVTLGVIWISFAL